MRLTRFHLFLLGVLFLVVMGPLAFTQPGPEGKKDRKGGPSPDFMFMMMSGGNDSFEVSKVQLRERPGGPTVEQQREQLLTYLQKKGVTNGVMTKAHFPDYWEERMTEYRTKMAEKGKQDGGRPTPSAVPGAPAQDPDAQAREAFAMLDTDKNGSLSVEEMQNATRMGSRIYDEREKWDTNRNGTIEFSEYVEYYKNRNSQRGNWGKGGQNPTPAVPESAKPIEDDKRPTVYRTGKMPKELPAWFEEADKDKDGQVGLYEWKAAGKSVSEFMAMDHNGDGFITVEEVLRHQRATAKVTDSPSVGASSINGFTAPTTDGGSGKGEGRGKGKGGWNMGGRKKGG